MNSQLQICFDPAAWEDYLYWQQHNPAIAQRINSLIGKILASSGTARPKSGSLKGDLAGLYSLHINLEHRLVYGIKNEQLIILQCRYHF